MLLFNLKIKNSKICNYCNEIDTQPHFFLLCEKVNHFWNYWFNWWKTLTGLNIWDHYDDLEEYILMGFPETSEDIEALNYCLLYTKYYIYIQRLFNNNELELYLCQTQIKTAIMIEYNISKNKNKNEVHKFNTFSQINENL